MDLKEDVKTIEAEVVDTVKKVEEVVVNEVEKIKSSMLAQKANFQSQLDQVKKEMADCQTRFEKAKVLGTKLEGALESLELLLKSSFK